MKDKQIKIIMEKIKSLEDLCIREIERRKKLTDEDKTFFIKTSMLFINYLKNKKEIS